MSVRIEDLELFTETPFSAAPIVDKESLKKVCEGYINKHCFALPIQTVHLNRLYNRIAARMGTTVGSVLAELHDERRIFVVKDEISNSNYAFSMEMFRMLFDTVQEEFRESRPTENDSDAYMINSLLKERIQLLIKNVRKAAKQPLK